MFDAVSIFHFYTYFFSIFFKFFLILENTVYSFAYLRLWIRSSIFNFRLVHLFLFFSFSGCFSCQKIFRHKTSTIKLWQGSARRCFLAARGAADIPKFTMPFVLSLWEVFIALPALYDSASLAHFVSLFFFILLRYNRNSSSSFVHWYSSSSTNLKMALMWELNLLPDNCFCSVSSFASFKNRIFSKTLDVQIPASSSALARYFFLSGYFR